MKLTPFKVSVFAFICLIGLSACDNQNAGQDAGKKIDQTIEKIEIKIDDASQQMEDASEKATVNVADATITTKIKAAFLAESTIKSLDITVSTTEGVVTLTGAVDSLEASQKAAEIAGVVSNVKQVNNQLVIQ